MLNVRGIIVSILTVVLANPAIAQDAPASKPRTAAGAIKFMQDMLTRGTAEAKPWPGFARVSKVTNVVVKGNCLMTLSLADKSVIRIDLARAVGVRARISTNAPQSAVEIVGGVQPYEGVDLYLGDNAAVRRASDAMTFLQTSCDTSAQTGF